MTDDLILDEDFFDVQDAPEVDDPESLSWLRAMILAIVYPSDETWQRIANDPHASFGRAMRWVITSVVLGMGLYITIYWAMDLFNVVPQYFGLNTFNYGVIDRIVGFLALDQGFYDFWVDHPREIGFAMVVIAAVVEFLLWVFIAEDVGRLFNRGPQRRAQFAMCFAAVIAPLTFMSLLIGLIPWVGATFVESVVMIYQVVLLASVTRSLHDLTPLKGFFTAILYVMLIQLINVILVLPPVVDFLIPLFQ